MTAVKTFKQELSEYPWPPSSAIKAHGKRWMDGIDTETLWRKVSKAAPDLKAREFIEIVLRTRAQSAGLKPILNFHAEVRRRALSVHKISINSAMRSRKSLSEIADVLEDAAAHLRLYDQSLDIKIAQLSPDAVSRKNQNGSQARRAFALTMGEFFKTRCGLWMDEEVATLVDIALPRKEAATTIDEVKEFRKRRKTAT